MGLYLAAELSKDVQMISLQNMGESVCSGSQSRRKRIKDRKLLKKLRWKRPQGVVKKQRGEVL